MAGWAEGPGGGLLASAIADAFGRAVDADQVSAETARAAGPHMLCEDYQRKCPASDDSRCAGGYVVDGDDWLRCHGED